MGDSISLKRRAVLEIKKLLRAASLTIDQETMEEEELESMDEKEGDSAERKESLWETSRRNFFNSIDWVEMSKREDSLRKSFEGNIMISGVTITDEIKRRVISNL